MKYEIQEPTALERRFCDFFMQGHGWAESAKLAGYAPNGGRNSHVKAAQRCMARERVKRYLAELRAQVADKTGETVEQQVRELNEALEMARQNNAPGDMVRAVLAKARLTGTLVEKHEHRGRIEHQHEHRHESVSDTAAWLDELVRGGADSEVPQPRAH